ARQRSDGHRRLPHPGQRLGGCPGSGAPRRPHRRQGGVRRHQPARRQGAQLRAGPGQQPLPARPPGAHPRRGPAPRRGTRPPQLAALLAPRLSAGHELREPTSGESRAAEARVRPIQYIKLTTLLAIVLAAIAIALAARRYSERHYDVSAMLRCLGAQQRAILRLYGYQLLLLTGGAVLVGSILGWLTHLLVVAVIAPLLPVALPPPGLAPLASGAGTALLLVAGFALPPVLRLADSSPLRVFRRDLAPIPLSGWIVYGLAGG